VGRRERFKKALEGFQTPAVLQGFPKLRSRSLGARSRVASDSSEEEVGDPDRSFLPSAPPLPPPGPAGRTPHPYPNPQVPPTMSELEGAVGGPTSDSDREKLKEQARMDAEILEAKLQNDRVRLEELLLTLENDTGQLRWLKERAGILDQPNNRPTDPRGRNPFSLSSNNSLPNSRPQSAPPLEGTSGQTVNTPQYTLGAPVHPESLARVAERLGAIPKRTNPLANLSTPSYSDLRDPNLKRLEMEAVKRRNRLEALNRVRDEEGRVRDDIRRKNDELKEKERKAAEEERTRTVRAFKRVMKPLATSQGALEDEAESDDDVIEEELNLRTRPATVTPSNSDPDTGFETVPPGIWRSFLHTAKALGNLNDKTRRDKERTVRRTAQHLRQVTERNVTEDFDASLSKYDAVIEERIADALARSMERSRTELLGLLASGIGDRVTKLEENERLSSRVSVEKKDAIVPCSGHPVADADEEQVRKAHLAMSKISATANTVTPFRTDPYNYSSYMASESNKIALTHGLSEKQHRQLVLDTIPSLSSAHRFFARSADLTDLFLMISTSATSSLTRTDLEKAINAWKLDNSSQDALFTSIMDLHSLLDRNREDYHQQDACEPTLFKQIISRITQQPDLPNFIRESLQQARMRIRQTDRVSELYTSLIAACNKYVGMKSRYPQNKSIKSEAPPLAIEHHSGGTKTSTVAATTSGSTSAQDSGNSRGRGRGRGRGKGRGKGNATNTTQDSADQSTNQGRGRGRGGRGGASGGEYKRSFVKPWPEGKPYLNKSGNQVSKEFEDWFLGHCYKCGHKSHSARDCRTYPEKSTMLSVCNRCGQGLHEVCRSKRRDLVDPEAGIRKIEDSMMKKMKSLLTEHGQQYYQGYYPPNPEQYYQGYYPPNPGQFSSASSIPNAVKHEATSEGEG